MYRDVTIMDTRQSLLYAYLYFFFSSFHILILLLGVILELTFQKANCQLWVRFQW